MNLHVGIQKTSKPRGALVDLRSKLSRLRRTDQNYWSPHLKGTSHIEAQALRHVVQRGSIVKSVNRGFQTKRDMMDM